MTTEKIFQNNKIELVITNAWVLSVGAMSNAEFIKKYAMLAFECMLFIWLNVRFVDNCNISASAYEYLLLSRRKGVVIIYLCILGCPDFF